MPVTASIKALDAIGCIHDCVDERDFFVGLIGEVFIVVCQIQHGLLTCSDGGLVIMDARDVGVSTAGQHIRLGIGAAAELAHAEEVDPVSTVQGVHPSPPERTRHSKR